MLPGSKLSAFPLFVPMLRVFFLFSRNHLGNRWLENIAYLKLFWSKKWNVRISQDQYQVLELKRCWNLHILRSWPFFRCAQIFKGVSLDHLSFLCLQQFLFCNSLQWKMLNYGIAIFKKKKELLFRWHALLIFRCDKTKSACSFTFFQISTVIEALCRKEF